MDLRGRRHDAADAAIGLGAVAAVWLVSAHIEPGPRERPLEALAYALIVVACGSLALRRRFPVTVLAVSSLAVAAYSARDYAGGPVYLMPLVAMYTVASTREWRAAAPYVGAAMGVQLLGGLVSNVGYVGWIVVYSGWAAAAVFLGTAGRNRRQYLASLEERARRLEETRDEEARRRVAEERLRIARDLHDVVSHTLSGIAVQAGAGAHVIDRDPAQAREALLAIKDASSEAMGELRAILGVLRQGADDDGARRSPAPSLDGLGALVTSAARAGLPVEIVVRGDPYDLPAAAEIAAYRIVQESLTNVVRHAGHARATVALDYRDDALVVEVVDDGSGVGAAPGAAGEGGVGEGAVGHGIAGMRERVSAVGGSLDARPRPAGGFLVRARLPRPAT